MLRKKEGSITVFLSITGVLIFALLGTLIETARMCACAGHASRTLHTATEALLSEYSRPLYEHYGLFFLESAGPSYEKTIAKYANDMFEDTSSSKMNFFEGQISGIQVTERTKLGDDGAKALRKEISEYMGRKVTKQQMKQFLNQSKNLENTEEQAKEIEEKVEDEKEMAEVDTELLNLMKLIDGITVSSGNVHCVTDFVKGFTVSEKKAVVFGITESSVWNVMSPQIMKIPKTKKGLLENKSKLVSKIKRVILVTNQALEQAGIFRSAVNKWGNQSGEFADYARKMKQFASKLSVLEQNKKVLSDAETLLKSEITEDIVSAWNILWKEYDTTSIVFDYTGVGEAGGGENPLDVLGDAWGDGILNLVCTKPESISKKSVTKPDHYAELYEEDSAQKQEYDERIDHLAKEETVQLSGVLGEMGGYIWDEFCLDAYIQDKFASYTVTKSKEEWSHSLDYQWEYIVAGGKSDKNNLVSILNRILLIRAVMNFTGIYKDTGKKAQAYAAAAAIIGFTGLEPLVRLTQTLILVVWSVVESLVDVSGLLQERDVPLVKTSSKIKTTFTQLFQINRQSITQRAKSFAKAGNKTFGYKEYLLLFLATTNQSLRLYRVMDQIQWDMKKNGYQDFVLGTCVFSLQIKGTFNFPTKFFRYPVIAKMLGRSVNSYNMSSEITKSYL